MRRLLEDELLEEHSDEKEAAPPLAEDSGIGGFSYEFLRRRDATLRRDFDGTCATVATSLIPYWGENPGLPSAAVLKTFATLLSQGLRAEDMVARYGGEEFVILSRGVDLATATQIADRLRWSVASTPMNVGPRTIQVTVSAGEASLACCGEKRDRETLLGLADQRLYQAKESGRNRVVGAY